MGAQFLYARLPHLAVLPVSFSASGDNTIIAGLASYRTHIHRIWITFTSATSIIFKSDSNVLSGTIPVTSYGTFTFDITGEPWFSTGIGESFVINIADAVGVNGMVYYKQEPQ